MRLMMDKAKLKIIEGNGKDRENKSRRKFISAYATNTRLMGVVGMYIHWKMNDEDYYQLFHFDAEEYGFDNYISLYGNNNKERFAIERETMMGGLGGQFVSLKENEARYIFQIYMSMNIKNNLPLPEPRSEYAFLYKNRIRLNTAEKNSVINKICETIESEYQAINYFLMRTGAKDAEGAAYLTGSREIILCEGKHPATLLKNTIEEEHDTEKGVSYVCESLIEEKLKYRLEITEILLKNENGKIYISDAQKRSALNISPAEAALMLSRPEYINIYSIDKDEGFIELLKKKKPNALFNIHSSVYLFTEFNLNNSHVKEKIYMLNGDIYGVYCISEAGQFIVACYNLDKMHRIENYLSKGDFKHYISLVEKLEFKESILYEFVNSGYEDFFDFLTDF